MASTLRKLTFNQEEKNYMSQKLENSFRQYQPKLHILQSVYSRKRDKIIKGKVFINSLKVEKKIKIITILKPWSNLTKDEEVP